MACERMTRGDILLISVYLTLLQYATDSTVHDITGMGNYKERSELVFPTHILDQCHGNRRHDPL